MGRGFPGNSNFFNFTHYLKAFELNVSIKLRNQFARIVNKPVRTRNKDKAQRIRPASESLEAGKISVAEFLDYISDFKENKLTQPTNPSAVIVSNDESESQYDFTEFYCFIFSFFIATYQASTHRECYVC